MSLFRSLLSIEKAEKKYTEILYLESTGTEYINTGVYGNSNIDVEIDANLTDISIDNGIYGSQVDASTSRNKLAYLYNTGGASVTYWFYFANNNYAYAPTYNNSFYLDRHVYKTLKYDFYIDGSKVLLSYFGTESEKTTPFTTTIPMYLFAVNDNNTDTILKGKSKIYSCKIWDNGVLVRDYIPVLDENNTPCLYDKITEEFFYNAGTGTFNYGTSLNYVSDGLYRMYDGEYNTNAGHSITATAWHDRITSSNNITLHNVTYGNKYVTFNGSNAYGRGSLGFSPNNYTIELCVNNKSLSYSSLVAGIYADSSYSNWRAIFWFNGANNVDQFYMKQTNNTELLITIDNYLRNNFTNSLVTIQFQVTTDNLLKIYANGVKFYEASYTPTRPESFSYMELARFSSYYEQCDIYSIRMYNRVLTEAELTKNYQNDVSRFAS